MSRSRPPALREWAVTCDALARGEQVLLLRQDRLEEPDLPSAEAGEESPNARGLAHEAFWLCPTFGEQSARDVADPYRDRIRALEGLRRDDARVRIQYLAVAEYSERIGDRERLLALDGHHTLNASAVERRLAEAPGSGLLLAILRIYRRAEAVPVGQGDRLREGRGWAALPDRPELRASPADRDMTPVIEDDRFLRLKAEVLQLSGSVRAV